MPVPITWVDGIAPALSAANLNSIETRLLTTSATHASSYTLVAADALTAVEFTSATGVNCTVPPNSSVAFAVGTVIEVHQYGAGQVTLVAGSGVTLRTPSSLTTRAQYSSLSIRKRATDEWIVGGDMT